MKAEYAIEEIKKIMKKHEKNNRIRAIILIVLGFGVALSAILFILSKFKKDNDFIFDDWSELDDMDYDDYEDEDLEDYSELKKYDFNLDSEDEEEKNN